MAERREEKYLIDYAEYALISRKIRALLPPDKNGINGRYSICSIYFDDPYDTALADKEDGNAVHIKYRIRTYDGSKKLIRLERKTKRGIITEKDSAIISQDELTDILLGEPMDENADCFGLVSQMRAGAIKPVVSVRYDREAYVFPQLGIRVTFDMNIDALPPDKDVLFGKSTNPIPALGRNYIIMEIKYRDRCPSFIRKACATNGMQISVSKYALCRNAPILNIY